MNDFEKLAAGAGRANAARALFGLFPRATNPLLREVQDTTQNALVGAVSGEAVADLLQKDKYRGHAALLGATTLTGQHLGSRYLPKRLFPKAVKGFTSKQVSAGRGLGALAGIAAGLLALQGIKYLKRKDVPDEQTSL